MSLDQKALAPFGQLAALEVPFGYSLVRDDNRYTFDDPRNIAATETRFTSFLAFFGVKSLAMHQEVPRSKERVQLGEFLWEFGLMDLDKVYHAPEWVCDRMATLQKANVPFAWFLYAEERFSYPQVEPAQRSTPKPAPVTQRVVRPQPPQKRRDPAIMGIIPTDYQRRIGWWYLIAAWLH